MFGQVTDSRLPAMGSIGAGIVRHAAHLIAELSDDSFIIVAQPAPPAISADHISHGQPRCGSSSWRFTMRSPSWNCCHRSRLTLTFSCVPSSS
jgi:hypothetical protein